MPSGGGSHAATPGAASTRPSRVLVWHCRATGWWTTSRSAPPISAATRRRTRSRAPDPRATRAKTPSRPRYEGALPAPPACNADCLGCISLQTDGEAPAPQPRMRFAPTAAELAGMASFHLGGPEAGIVSFGQGCEGEPLTRDDVLAPDRRTPIGRAHGLSPVT